MLGFSPFKKRPNQFNYTPRYYDPEKEAREERRAELRGERSEDANREYRPGMYIRRQSEARASRRERHTDSGRKRIWSMALGAAAVLLFIALLYPRLADWFIRMSQGAQAERAAVEQVDVQPRGGLDQTGISDVEWQEQAITVVPDDYQE